MKETIVNKPEINLIGVELETTNRDNVAMQEVPPFWERFITMGILEKIPNKLNDHKIIAVHTHYKDETCYSLIIGAEVRSLDTIPSGMVSVTIPAGKYAEFKTHGDVVGNVIETWQHVLSSAFTYERTFVADYEVYHQKQSVIDGTGLVDIYVGIK